MRTNKIISAFTNAYALVRPDNLLQISLFRNAYVFAYFHYKKLFEDPFWRLARQQPQLFSDGDILDIGANIGYTACIFASAMKSGSKVFAFEPDRLSYSILQQVVQRKRLVGSIETINAAVGNSDGVIEFWHNERHPADHRIATEQFRERAPADVKFSSIPVTTIDTFVANRGLQNISFIKVDVQGYELAVCEGMERTLERFPKLCVCVEYCPSAMTELGFEPPTLLEFFRARGYSVYSLAGANLMLLTDQNSLEASSKNVDYVDVLFTKRALS